MSPIVKYLITVITIMAVGAAGAFICFHYEFFPATWVIEKTAQGVKGDSESMVKEWEYLKNKGDKNE